MLRVEGLETSYGRSQVLFGVDLDVGTGEVVTLMGRNGMGKTTTVRSILRLTPPHKGRVIFEGRDLSGLPSHKVARAGFGLVPEGRQVFPTLTVRENLVATARRAEGGRAGWNLERVFELFPRLRERSNQVGRTLSGGEQQMLAIGRALMTNPKLLILDEATEGLAPLIRREIWACLRRLKAEGQSILLIDKNIAALSRIADRHVILEKGRVVWHGDTAALLADEGIKLRYLGV
jgi:branched-chain amino acid transport system ATP-binding protein